MVVPIAVQQHLRWRYRSQPSGYQVALCELHCEELRDMLISFHEK